MIAGPVDAHFPTERFSLQALTKAVKSPSGCWSGPKRSRHRQACGYLGPSPPRGRSDSASWLSRAASSGAENRCLYLHSWSSLLGSFGILCMRLHSIAILEFWPVMIALQMSSTFLS